MLWLVRAVSQGLDLTACCLAGTLDTVLHELGSPEMKLGFRLSSIWGMGAEGFHNPTFLDQWIGAGAGPDTGAGGGEGEPTTGDMGEGEGTAEGEKLHRLAEIWFRLPRNIKLQTPKLKQALGRKTQHNNSYHNIIISKGMGPTHPPR